MAPEDGARVWRYLREGGAANHEQFFRFLGARYLDRSDSWREPRVLPRCLIYRPAPDDGDPRATYEEWAARWRERNPGGAVVLLLFYRSHLQTENARMFDELVSVIESGV